jgi:deoxyguanosine kinase
MTFRIEIAAGIAVGKTTLCDALQARGHTIISEKLDENPFLTRAYADKGSRGFDVGMSFLMSKASGIETYDGQAPIAIVDYSMIAEYAYNDVHLKHVNAHAHKIVEQAIDFRRNQIGDPDILIHLQCPVDHQLANIKKRGRDFEQGHTAAYLLSINNGIAKWSQAKIGAACKMLHFDTQVTDVSSPAFIDTLMNIIRAEMAAKAIATPAPKPAP